MDDQEKLNNRLTQAALLGDLAAVEQALEDGADARARNSCALAVAATGGHGKCVRVLIPVSDPMDYNSGALFWAAKKGDAECVRLLIPASDPLAGDSIALRRSAGKGHAECVALLLPVSDPLAKDADGVDAAAAARMNNHLEVAGMIEAFIESQAISSSCDLKLMRYGAFGDEIQKSSLSLAPEKAGGGRVFEGLELYELYSHYRLFMMRVGEGSGGVNAKQGVDSLP